LVLTSPFLLLVIMHAKARRVVVRATLSVLLPLLRAAARALGVLPSADADPNARVVEDPDLPVWLAGVSSLVAAERRAKKSLWEWWLDALHFSPDSPGRAHIRQLLSHPETARKLEALFDALDTQAVGKLDKDALVRFSAGIRGTVRVLLNRERARVADGAGHARPARDGAASIELEPATARESKFLVDNFDLLFPDEHPLDLAAFLSMAKLVSSASHRESAREAARTSDGKSGHARAGGGGPLRRRRREQIKSLSVPSAHGRAQHRARRGRTQARRDRGVARRVRSRRRRRDENAKRRETKFDAETRKARREDVRRVRSKRAASHVRRVGGGARDRGGRDGRVVGRGHGRGVVVRLLLVFF
jgi:hypothetical protein